MGMAANVGANKLGQQAAENARADRALDLHDQQGAASVYGGLLKNDLAEETAASRMAGQIGAAMVRGQAARDVGAGHDVTRTAVGAGHDTTKLVVVDKQQEGATVRKQMGIDDNIDRDLYKGDQNELNRASREREGEANRGVKREIGALRDKQGDARLAAGAARDAAAAQRARDRERLHAERTAITAHLAQATAALRNVEIRSRMRSPTGGMFGQAMKAARDSMSQQERARATAEVAKYQQMLDDRAKALADLDSADAADAGGGSFSQPGADFGSTDAGSIFDLPSDGAPSLNTAPQSVIHNGVRYVHTGEFDGDEPLYAPENA